MAMNEHESAVPLKFKSNKSSLAMLQGVKVLNKVITV